MKKPALDNLARTGQLKTEPAAQAELDGLTHSGRVRLADAANPALNLEIDEAVVTAPIRVTTEVDARLRALGKPCP